MADLTAIHHPRVQDAHHVEPVTGAFWVLAMTARLPVGHGAVRADALDEGHEGTDTALPVFPVLHGHRRASYLIDRRLMLHCRVTRVV
jgi:hypothetical protein